MTTRAGATARSPGRALAATSSATAATTSPSDAAAPTTAETRARGQGGAPRCRARHPPAEARELAHGSATAVPTSRSTDAPLVASITAQPAPSTARAHIARAASSRSPPTSSSTRRASSREQAPDEGQAHRLAGAVAAPVGPHGRGEVGEALAGQPDGVERVAQRLVAEVGAEREVLAKGARQHGRGGVDDPDRARGARQRARDRGRASPRGSRAAWSCPRPTARSPACATPVRRAGRAARHRRRSPAPATTSGVGAPVGRARGAPASSERPRAVASRRWNSAP